MPGGNTHLPSFFLSLDNHIAYGIVKFKFLELEDLSLLDFWDIEKLHELVVISERLVVDFGFDNSTLVNM